MARQSLKGQKLAAKKLRYELLKLFRRQPSKRLNAKQLIKKLRIKNNKTSVEDALAILSSQGKIAHVKDGKYKLIKTGGDSDAMQKKGEIVGLVDRIRSGAAYIITEDPRSQDIYVPAKRLGYALDGDKVSVRVRKQYGNRVEGEIIAVLERSTEQFIGDFHQSRHSSYVIPDNRMVAFDVYVHPSKQGSAQDGDKVLVRVNDWPSKPNKSPSGTIVKVLDTTDGHGLMMDSILINHGFDTLFSKVVLKEALELPRAISQEEINRRRDYRNVPTITIDPLTARDFDDALSFRSLENGCVEVGIHIADVTHYVTPGGALDKEALRRSTSVYLVDRVAPMLPEALSNELCSLRPEEDSLTFSAIFQFDQRSKLIDRWFGKTVIHSIKRFNYEEAQEVIDTGTGPYAEMLNSLNKLAHFLRKKRYKQGAIAFETQELQFELDENNHPVAIHAKVRKDTHMLVEDFMLLANREVAAFISKKNEREIPFVYRVHDLPDPEKLADYSLFLKELGFEFDYQSPEQIRKSFRRLSRAAKKDEVLAFAEQFAVRTMAKAVYTTENIGHFGLGFTNYAHFTSPIRRYADVLVHRILEKNLSGDFRTSKTELEAQCRHISNQEKKAQEAERESIKFKQVEFIAGHIGSIFDGVVSGMVDRGFFVALANSGVEGMVEFIDLNEPFDIDPGRLKAISRRNKRIIRIGDRVRVRIVAARISDMEVDMELIEDE